MARQEFLLTESWQQLATKKAVITITQLGEGTINLNDSPSDTAAMIRSSRHLDHQIIQDEEKPTYIKYVKATPESTQEARVIIDEEA